MWVNKKKKRKKLKVRGEASEDVQRTAEERDLHDD